MSPFAIAALAFGLLVAAPVNAAKAQEARPDDAVSFSLTAEDWVSTKTARVVLAVESAVTEETSGTMRAAMAKAVDGAVKADWRVTAFNRAQDQTGMERWSAEYEARVPETNLSGLADKAKKNSKAGLQVTVRQIDFSPTLEEVQTAYGALRERIYKTAVEHLAALNAGIPGRGWRIARIDFVDTGAPPRPAPAFLARGKAALMHAMDAVASSEGAGAPLERSEKLTLTAQVILSAVAPKP